MNDSSTPNSSPRSRRLPPVSVYRRHRFAGLIVILGLLILVVNVSQWLQHARLRSSLDLELRDRLLGVAQAAAVGIDGEMLRRWSDWGVDLDEDDRLRATLGQIVAANAVSNIDLLDLDGGSIIDLSAVLERGEINPLIALDRPAFILATAGFPEASALRVLDGQYLKAAYVPIESDDGEVVAVLAVEGAADLFLVLDELRRTMVAVAIGSVLGIVLLGIILVRISDSLARAERELLRRESLTSMGRMAAGIAHEIRNPLGIIRATAERLRRGLGDDERQSAGVDSIVEEVDRLNGIVSGYLNFASEKPSEFRRLDLAELLRRSLRLASAELDGVAVSTEFELPTAPMQGDAARLHQVFLNLILNARQAMPAGGSLRVSLGRAPTATPSYRLCLTDTGVGIARAQLREVWKPFFTSKPEGSGLGLTIVRRILTEHRGTIRLDSEAGSGTTVTVDLPALVQEDGAGSDQP